MNTLCGQSADFLNITAGDTVHTAAFKPLNNRHLHFATAQVLLHVSEIKCGQCTDQNTFVGTGGMSRLSGFTF